jgi:molybdopterin-guanine dinucleotide biosynthesis protein A
MGRDKSRLQLGSRSMLAHIRAVAKASGASVRVIRRDTVPRCGPLGGIYTALKTTRFESVLFLACDMPHLKTDLVSLLLEQFDSSNAALFARTEGRLGFPFVLRRSDFPTVVRQIERGEFSLQKLAKVLKAKIARVPREWCFQLANVNTPADWEKTRRFWPRAG